MIREFHPDDMETCVHLLIEAYNGEPWNCHWTIETATRYLKEFVSNDKFVGFVLCDNETIVGALFAHRKTWWTNDELFVDELYITPRLQRQGYGERLLTHAEHCQIQRTGWIDVINQPIFSCESILREKRIYPC